MGEILGHQVYKTISSGCGTLGEGSDALCAATGIRAEYKTKALEEKDLRNLFERSYGHGKNYAPLRISGVYNNAMKPGILDKYAKIDHYFGCFYREKCVLIIKVDTEHVIDSLEYEIEKKIQKKSTTTNLCSVPVSLRDTHLYEIVHKDQDFFDKNK
jgi:hypothetical protein